MEQSTANDKTDYLWKIPLACFVLAGVTGFLYRLGMIGGLPSFLNLSMENIRHAHSHLMFFGWAVPLPLYFLYKHVSAQSNKYQGGLQWMKYSIAGGLFVGLLAYPFFLFYGYRPVEIGASALPLSVILSGFVMVCWYGFMWGYYQSRGVLQGDSSQPWFDGALIMLLVCSLGAWGVAVVQAVDPANHLFMKGLTHFFLATFTEGWVVVVIVAVLVLKLGLKSSDWLVPENVALACIVIGAPLTFSYGISESLLSPVMLIVARTGGGLAAIGLLLFVHAIIRSKGWSNIPRVWMWAVALLGLKAVMQLAASVIPSSFWLSDHALRILYLHVLLLGAFTITMIAGLHKRTSMASCYYHYVVGAILAVLFSLLMPTRFWPGAWQGIWMFYLLAAVAMLPPLAIVVYWMKMTAKIET